MSYSFWKGKTKLRPTDIKFSIFIRKRDKKCMLKVKCYGQTVYDEFGEPDIRALECSHYKGRAREATRMDQENCDAFCKKCHHWVENTVEGKKYYDDWKKKQLGEERYNLLLLRSESRKDRDDKMDMIIIKELLKEQENGEC